MNMTSEINLEDIYTELNNLLKDVCSFLTNEAQNGTLSAKAKNEAEKLVSRSRQQVDIVTKLSVIQESSSSNYPYLEMQRPGEAEDPLSEYVPPDITDYYEPEHYEESYAPVDNEPSPSPQPPPSTPTVNGELCLYSCKYYFFRHKNETLYKIQNVEHLALPHKFTIFTLLKEFFLDLPLSMIEEKSVKFGPLCRKERYLFLEQKKQYMAGLVGYWLLIYACNKRDNKPLQMINLLNYSAKAIEQRKDPAFEIYAENEKTYEFIARSIKDMEQWVVAINCKKHICTNGRNLPEIPSTTNSEEMDNPIRNSDQTNSDNQNVMHYGSEEDIYASVEDFGKPEIPKPLPAPAVEDFPKLPPRSTKELPSLPKRSTLDNTYNNLQKTESEENNDDDDTNSEYYFVQCPDTQNEKSNEEEQLEIYDEVKVTETININVIRPFISNTNTPQENYDSVDTREEEELEDYDTVKPSKIPIKVNVPPQNNEQEDEEIADYDEIYVPSRLKQTLNKPQKDEVLENYDELKPTTSKQPTQVSPENRSEEEEILEDYDFLKPVSQNIQSKQNQPHSTSTKEEEFAGHDVLNPTPENKLNISVQITKPPDDTDNTKLSQAQNTLIEQTENNSKKSENNNDTKPAKPIKPMKKFWEKRLSSESPKKETSDTEDESKLSIANIKTKLNAQLLLNVQDKNKPLIKPKTQTLLNKFPSFSKNRNSKDDDGNSKVQNIRQQLEHTFRNKNN